MNTNQPAHDGVLLLIDLIMNQTIKTIWKYPLLITEEQSIEMPAGAEILCVQNQAGQLCLWALVDPKAEKVEHLIAIYGTGRQVAVLHEDYERKYIGTVQQSNGELVWHVFELVYFLCGPKG